MLCVAAYRNLGDDAQRSAQLDNDIAQLGDGLMAESSHIECEYLLLTARKA